MPTSYLTMSRGTPVVDRFGQHVGTVDRVLVHDVGTFDGILVRTEVGKRFVDAPEVRRVADRAVVLGIAVWDVQNPRADERYQGAVVARWDRVSLTEADRDAAIDALKTAFVRDQLTPDELGRRVEVAHEATTLDELDAALADISLV